MHMAVNNISYGYIFLVYVTKLEYILVLLKSREEDSLYEELVKILIALFCKSSNFLIYFL